MHTKKSTWMTTSMMNVRTNIAHTKKSTWMKMKTNIAQAKMMKIMMMMNVIKHDYYYVDYAMSNYNTRYDYDDYI